LASEPGGDDSLNGMHGLPFINEIFRDRKGFVKPKFYVYVKGIASGTTGDAKRFDIIQLQTFKMFYAIIIVPSEFIF
jgi:hypothetical protein